MKYYYFVIGWFLVCFLIGKYVKDFINSIEKEQYIIILIITMNIVIAVLAIVYLRYERG
jgi:hypothetical protein